MPNIEPGDADWINRQWREGNDDLPDWYAELDPTRPADSELLPPAHLHNDGHYCYSGACAVTAGLRDRLCMACQLAERDQLEPSRGMDRK